MEIKNTGPENAGCVFDWARGVAFAVTICDKEGKILYMNDKAATVFGKYGNLTGKNLLECHSARSREIIKHLLETGSSNSYTILKNGMTKIIHQTPWYTAAVNSVPSGFRKEEEKTADREIGGLVEISIELPANLPHYIRE